MKKFIYNGLGFFLVFLIVSHAGPLYLFYTEKYKNSVAGSDIYYSISKSKKKNKSKKLLLGDSVANQMFTNTVYNGPINSLACNKAIGLAGQFILLDSYLKAGNKVDTVYLAFNPFSFKNNLNDLFTYHYFLKPFYTKEYENLFTKTVMDQIHKIPYVSIRRYPYILTSNWGPGFISKDKAKYKFLSPISQEYLLKIKDLSIKYNFDLLIIPVPVNISKKHELEKIHRDELVISDLKKEFDDYFEKIIYLHDSNFVDGVHLKNPGNIQKFYHDKFLK